MENGYLWTTPFFLAPPQEVEERAKYLISRCGPTVREATNSYSMEAYYLFVYLSIDLFIYNAYVYIYIHVLDTCIQ